MATIFLSPTCPHIVNLHEVGDSGGCPGDILTLNCSVHSNTLEWHCTDHNNRKIYCGSNESELLTVMCHSQTLTPKSHKCYLDNTIITSVVEISISSESTTWTCMNPRVPSQNKSRTVGVEGKFPYCKYCV